MFFVSCENTSLMSCRKAAHRFDPSFKGQSLAIASITYFANLRNRSAFVSVLASASEMFCHSNAIVRRQ